MIIFTQHALLKLKQRGIKKDLVIKTLNHSDYNFRTYKERMVALKKFGKNYLKVIFRKEDKNIIVISQHWVEKFKK